MDDSSQRTLEDNDIFSNAFSGVETIHSLGIGVISEVDATMPPELPEESNFQDDDGTEGWFT